MLKYGFFFKNRTDLFNHVEPEFFVSHFTATEEYLDTHFVTLSEELTHFSELDVEVALSNFKPKSHLLEFALLVAAAVFLRLFHLLVLEFTPVDDFSNRRVSVW